MNIYTEDKTDYGTRREWNCSHPSGYAGKVTEDYYTNGILNFREFTWDGYRHRDPAEGPAFEAFFPNGQLECRVFLFKEKYHRPVADGPAREYFHEDGRLHWREHWEHGVKQE